MNLVNLEERSQGDGAIMAKEYEMLTSDSSCSSQGKSSTSRNSGELGTCSYDNERTSSTDQERGSCCCRRGCEYSQRRTTRTSINIFVIDLVLGSKNSNIFVIVLMKKKSSEAWPYRGCNRPRINSGNARQTLPTMHGELNELRRALKLQEDIQARTRSELEAARHCHQGLRQPSSSMPISSRTTESGWEYLSRDRVQAFPVGSEIRSPEIHTPSHRSPVNREVFDFTGNKQHAAQLVTEGAAPEPSCLVLTAKHPSALRSVQRWTIKHPSASRSVQRRHLPRQRKA